MPASAGAAMRRESFEAEAVTTGAALAVETKRRRRMKTIDLRMVCFPDAAQYGFDVLTCRLRDTVKRVRNWRRKARWLGRWELVRFDLRAVKAWLVAKRRVGFSPPRGGGLKPTLRSAQALPPIICLPIIEWDFRFQRPQQLMMRFANAGYRVVYVTKRDVPSSEKHRGVTEISVKDVEVPEDAIVIVQHPGWWPV